MFGTALTWLHVSDYHIFGTLKDGSLQINSLEQLFQLQNVFHKWRQRVVKNVFFKKTRIFCQKAKIFV